MVVGFGRNLLKVAAMLRLQILTQAGRTMDTELSGACCTMVGKYLRVDLYVTNVALNCV